MGFDWLGVLWAFLHDLAVAVYVGGAIAMEFVLGPAQRAIPPAQAQIMGEKTADRFLWLVWISLLLILVTGVLRLWQVGLIGGSTGFFVGPMSLEFAYGRTLGVMFIIWLVLVVNGALITFVLRPRLTAKLGAGVEARHADADRDRKARAATWIQHLTRVDLVLALVAVLLGASLFRGGLL